MANIANIDIFNEKEKYSEDEIDRRMKTMFPRRSKLSYSEKREKVIQRMNEEYHYKYEEYLDFSNNRLILFDIELIRRKKAQFLDGKIKELRRLPENSKLSDSEIRDIILDDMNDSETFIIYNPPDKTKQLINKENIKLINKENINQSLQSILDESTKQSIRDLSTEGTSVNECFSVVEEKWIKKEYYDINYLPNSNKQPKIYFIYGNYFAYNYPNDTQTYCFTQSKSFSKDEYNIDIINKSEHFKEEYGLCFCGKKIEEYNKICKPGEMMCRECMEETKKLYKLDKNILINIHGRACKRLKDNKYYCLGKITDNYKTVKLCSTNFMCNSCKLINNNLDYYNIK